MPKRQRSRSERDVAPQEQEDHAKDTRFQARQSLSDCIKAAALVFDKQLEDYWAMQAELEIKFNEVFESPNATLKDLVLIINLQINTTGAAMEIIAALERLARLLPVVE